MGYMHIDNLYKNPDILLFKECYALEKVHGTSAHIEFVAAHTENSDLGNAHGVESFEEVFVFFGGSVKPERFMQIVLAQSPDLLAKIKTLDPSPQAITIFGEAYGGSVASGMSATYGKEVRFIAFDVMIGDKFLDVPTAEKVVLQLGLEFVPYARIPATEEAIEAEKTKVSDVGLRRTRQANPDGSVSFHAGLREGVVLRPLVEVTKNNGARIMSKHKHKDFEERMNPPKIEDPLKQEKLAAGKAIADEWVTPMRLEHVLDKIPKELHTMANTKAIIEAMVEDVYREAKGEVVESKEATTAIGGRTAKLLKERIMNQERMGGL